MKVAVVQFEASAEKGPNLERAIAAIGESASSGAALCAFQEFMMFYTDASQTRAQLERMAEPMNGNFVGAICDAAKSSGIQVVGSLYENDGGKVYDTSFIVDQAGCVISKYRKIHLYDALDFRESDKMDAGSVMADPAGTSIGMVGMMICYDLRFPEMARSLAVAGADVLVAPSAWVRGDMKVEHWFMTNRVRAVENGCYVVAPDHVGNIYCGRSLVVDPFGRILLDMGERHGIGYADIDLDAVDQTRAKLPLLDSRRTDIYLG